MSVSVDEALFSALVLGDVVFETILIEEGVPLFWEEHLERLRHSAAASALKVPEADLLAERMKQAIAEGDKKRRSRARLILGPEGRVHCSLTPEGDVVPSVMPGIRLRLREDRRLRKAGLPKAPIYGSIMAKRRETSDADELLLHREGTLLDAGSASIALLIEGGWWLPRLELPIRAGVTRQILSQPGALHMQEGALKVDDLGRADELLLMSSIAGPRLAAAVVVDPGKSPAIFNQAPELATNIARVWGACRREAHERGLALGFGV